jgi:TonB family protein
MSYRVEARYPESARWGRVTGEVILEAVVRRDGSVGEIRVLRGLPLGCTDAAREALQHSRFRPAMHAGLPVDLPVTVTYRFGFK